MEIRNELIDYGQTTYSAPSTFTLECFDIDGYPNGDNRTMQVPFWINIDDLLHKIYERYGGLNHVTKYENEYGEKMILDTDESLNDAKDQAVKWSFIDGHDDKVVMWVTVELDKYQYWNQCKECGQMF